jgi:hypothetical protein
MASKTTNCVAEWFGHRVYPSVAGSSAALQDQTGKLCPFLSEAMEEEKRCIKAKSSLGVCTISSLSNGPRQDWLACPYRGLDRSLLLDVAERLFSQDSSDDRLVVAAPNLAKAKVRKQVLRQATAGEHPIVYFQDKLGGEISISKTQRSPELSFDMTLAELGPARDGLTIPRYGILELQTMDFHGSYRHAVKNLEDALRLHKGRFHESLRENQEWLGDRIEGPNIANVFKRTFYQMMLKFQIARDPVCAGIVLALPAAVWDSWQRHLGAPELRGADDCFELRAPDKPPFSGEAPAWIYVFDIEEGADQSPNSIVLEKRIATDAESVSHFALKVAPEAAVGVDGSARLIPERIKQRMSTWWPEILDLLA